MAMREIANSGALSEFVAGYNGDCGETAELCLLHVLNPGAYPLDAAHLGAIVGRDIHNGWASASGAEPLSSIARDLDTLHIGYELHPYAEPFQADWRGALNTTGGIRPIVFELALGGALPGDETGLHYHFITCLGWDPESQEGIFADGDNSVVRGGKSGPWGLVPYTLAQLQAARICGMLICTQTPPPPPPPPAPTPHHYTIVGGDSLSGIAVKLHLANWFQDLYKPNMAEIEAAARAHGHPDSANGNLIFPGTVLSY